MFNYFGLDIELLRQECSQAYLEKLLLLTNVRSGKARSPGSLCWVSVIICNLDDAGHINLIPVQDRKVSYMIFIRHSLSWRHRELCDLHCAVR